MEKVYQQYLASLTPDEVSFIVSRMHFQADAKPVTCFQKSLSDDEDENRKRRHIEREWPEVGTVLSSEYYGTVYTAEIIPAAKRLKSGKQIRITSEPAQGIVCDSFSEAMLCATEIQRNEQSLARKGVSNGWMFWQWDGKIMDDQNDDDDALQT